MFIYTIISSVEKNKSELQMMLWYLISYLLSYIWMAG